MSHRGAEEHSGPDITGALATTQQTENLLPSQNRMFDSAKVFGQAVVRKGLYFLTTVPSEETGALRAVRVIIVGGGEVGFNTALMLSREQHDVVLIEQNEALVERATEQLDVLTIQGNGASPRLLTEAEVKQSDLLIATTNSDEVNIIACLAAKAQRVPRTVARLHNPDYYNPREPLARDMFKIDFVIHTEQMAAEEIKEALLVPGAINVETFAGDRIEVAEVILGADSPAVGLAVREIEVPEQSLIVGIVRNGEALIPRGDTVLNARDHVFLIGERRHVGRVVGAFTTDTAPVREVMIFGGISGGEFAPLADALGVDRTLSPRLLAAGAILRFVSQGEVVAVTLLESGAEMMELKVPHGCRIAGRALSEVGFPKGAIVGAILRKGEVIIPSGREAMRPGDDAVVFTLQEAVSKVGRLFAP